jgi:hypothetical protein
MIKIKRLEKSNDISTIIANPVNPIKEQVQTPDD